MIPVGVKVFVIGLSQFFSFVSSQNVMERKKMNDIITFFLFDISKLLWFCSFVSKVGISAGSFNVYVSLYVKGLALS